MDQKNVAPFKPSKTRVPTGRSRASNSVPSVSRSSSPDLSYGTAAKKPDWSVKHVQLRMMEHEDDFKKIRHLFDSLAGDDHEEVFSSLKFCFLDFSHFCTHTSKACVPAEFCCVEWSIKNGFEWIGGSPIDPGSALISDWADTLKQSQALAIPPPPYTYQRGPTYSVGEDRYGDIVDAIYDHAGYLDIDEYADVLSYNASKYVFVPEDKLPMTVGCLAFLMAVSERDPSIRVLPMERLLAELFRTCKLRSFTADLRQQTTANETEDSVDGNKPCMSRNNEPLQLVSSVDYAKKVVHRDSVLDSRVRHGCLWHQGTHASRSISLCCVTRCKKWVYIALQKSYDILGLSFDEYLKDLKEPDIQPREWSETDAMGIEFGQRFGFLGKISEKRVQVLEEGFIFPGLLDEIRARMPHGLKHQPTSIIWPLDRNIDLDLNYYPNAQIIISDPDPATRHRKLEELNERRAIAKAKAATFLRSVDDDGWK